MKYFMLFAVPVYLKYNSWAVYWTNSAKTFTQWIPSVYYSVSRCQFSAIQHTSSLE